MTTLERFKNITFYTYTNNKGNQERNYKNHRRLNSATQQTTSMIQTNILQIKGGIKRMESPILHENNNINSKYFAQNKNQYINSLKKERRLQTLDDCTSQNNTLNTFEKGKHQKSSFQISPTEIGLEKRRLKTLNDNNSILPQDKYSTIQSKNIQTISQIQNETQVRSKTLQTESLEGFKVNLLHDSLVNNQKAIRPKSNLDNYKTIQYNQVSSAKRNGKRLNYSQIQEPNVKNLSPIDRDKHIRVRSNDSRQEKIKPILQQQMENRNLQHLSTEDNSIYFFHTLDPSIAIEDSESKRHTMKGSYKVKNKNYINNNFNYKLKILRGILKKNQLSPENFTQQRINTETVKENSVILEENPSQYNLNSLRMTGNVLYENQQRFDTIEQKEKKNKDLFQISPQKNVKNKDVLKKFLTKTKQIKSKSFIENLETDNTCPDDSCQEQSIINTVEDFKSFYPLTGTQKESIQINQESQSSVLSNKNKQIKQKINDGNSKTLIKNNLILNNNINYLKPLQNIPQQPFYHAQQQIIQGAQHQKLLRKSINKIPDQNEKNEMGDSLNNSLIQQQQVKQIYSKLNNNSKTKQEKLENSPSQLTKLQNHQSLRKSYGSPLLRDSYGGNNNTITITENSSKKERNSENKNLSRDEIELNKFNEEKKKSEKQKFAPYKIDQYQQLVSQQNIQPLQQKNQNQQTPQNNQQNLSDYQNQQRYSFSFQYQQNVQQDPQILQQQMLSQISTPNNQQIPLKNIQGYKIIKLSPVHSEGNYGMPVPTNFSLHSTQQQYNESFSPHFSQQQFYESDILKAKNECSIKNNLQSRQNSQLKFENIQLSKQQYDNGANIIKISQLRDQCPPAPTNITLDFLSRKNEQEESYHTAFYHNQPHLKSIAKENQYGNNQNIQFKMLQASQALMSQQNSKPIINDSALSEVTSIQINSNHNIERLNKNFGSKILNGQVNEGNSKQIIFQKTNNQLKAESLIQQGKYVSLFTKINGQTPKKDEEPSKSLIIS